MAKRARSADGAAAPPAKRPRTGADGLRLMASRLRCLPESITDGDIHNCEIVRTGSLVTIKMAAEFAWIRWIEQGLSVRLMSNGAPRDVPGMNNGQITRLNLGSPRGDYFCDASEQKTIYLDGGTNVRVQIEQGSIHIVFDRLQCHVTLGKRYAVLNLFEGAMKLTADGEWSLMTSKPEHRPVDPPEIHRCLQPEIRFKLYSCQVSIGTTIIDTFNEEEEEAVVATTSNGKVVYRFDHIRATVKSGVLNCELQLGAGAFRVTSDDVLRLFTAYEEPE